MIISRIGDAQKLKPWVEEMFVSIKKFDDRPRILWRCLLTEPDESGECIMKDSPLELFICRQIRDCKLECVQKTEQALRGDYVHEQQLKMINKIEQASNINGNKLRINRK